MLELAEEEPPSEQSRHQTDLGRDLAQFCKDLDSLELKVFLTGPHDRNNCILSINSGAGGTEACDWAEMLLRMYQRWCEARGWEIELTDVLPGECAGSRARPCWCRANAPTAFARPSGASTAWCAFRPTTRTSGGTPVSPAWTSSRKSRKPIRTSCCRRRSCRWTPIVRAAKADRTSTRWKRRCASPICPPG